MAEPTWHVSIPAAAALRNAPDSLLLLMTITTQPSTRPCAHASKID